MKILRICYRFGVACGYVTAKTSGLMLLHLADLSHGKVLLFHICIQAVATSMKQLHFLQNEHLLAVVSF